MRARALDAVDDPLTAAPSAFPRREGAELRLIDCARAFVRFSSPRTLAVAFAIFLAARLAVGSWSWRDPAIAALLIAAQPFTEWVIHVALLHSRPRRIGPITVDLPTARMHRWHHRHPKALEGVLIPGSLIAGFFVPVLAVMWLLSWPWVLIGGDHLALWLTLMVVSPLLVGAYEWCHFLIHTPYRPKSRYYRSIWRSHRLHHFKNEHFWFGVSSDAADRVLGTFPDPRAVPRSETARTLGVE